MSWQLIFLAFSISFVSCGPAGKETDLKDEADDEIEGITTPAPLRLLEKWDEWKTREIPEKFLNLAPYYKSGYDYDGLPIFTVKYGKWNYRELAELNPEQLNDFWKYYEQSVRRAESEGAANNNAGIVFIIDWDGFSLENHTSSKALKMALKSFTYMTRFNYVILYGYMINTNFGAESFIDMSRPFLGDILDKFQICGTRLEKWKPALLRKIPASQLPPEYGGDKAWKAVEWNKQ